MRAGGRDRRGSATAGNRDRTRPVAKAVDARRRIGERLRMAFPTGGRKITTLVAGLRLTGMVAPMGLDRPSIGRWFEAYVRHVPIPEQHPDDIVIMDRLSGHKGLAVQELIEAAAAGLRLQAPYSRDFNPIETPFSRVKAVLRKIEERTLSGLWSRVGPRR
jgi:transposase